MTEIKHEKDKMQAQSAKSQIQLLKQKYLKKNITSPSNQPPTSPQQNYVQQISKPSIQIKQTPKQLTSKLLINNNLLSSPQPKKKQENPIIQITSSQREWSMRNFIEQKSDKKQQKLNEKLDISKKKDDILELQDKQYKRKFLNPNDPFSLKIQFKFVLDQQPKSVNQDPQFSQQQIKQNQYNSNSKKSIVSTSKQQQKDLSYACKLWTQNSQKALNYLNFTNSTPTFQLLPKPLILISSNPNFPGIVQQLAYQFIFNNTQILKDSQKEVVYKMALQYFSPSPNYLSDILLICLVKIMPLYGSIYSDQIIRKIGYYVQKIIQYKKYILKEELDCFIKCIEQRMENLRVEGHKLPIECFLWILILRPNSNYCNQILLVRNIDNQKQLLSIFCALYPEGKQNSLSIMYLKCIDLLLPVFIRSGILQKVISHLNQIKVPQILYQPVKSLKLKLIKNADPKKQKKKIQEDKGFISFLNQRVTKLKDILQAKVITKSKLQVYFNSNSGKYQSVNPLSNSRNNIV